MHVKSQVIPGNWLRFVRKGGARLAGTGSGKDLKLGSYEHANKGRRIKHLVEGEEKAIRVGLCVCSSRVGERSAAHRFFVPSKSMFGGRSKLASFRWKANWPQIDADNSLAFNLRLSAFIGGLIGFVLSNMVRATSASGINLKIGFVLQKRSAISSQLFGSGLLSFVLAESYK
jgi:hypothetical protein